MQGNLEHDVQSDSVNSVQERVECDMDDSDGDSRPVSRQNDLSSVSSNSAEHVNLESIPVIFDNRVIENENVLDVRNVIPIVADNNEAEVLPEITEHGICACQLI